jgi:hypothetical protein
MVILHVTEENTAVHVKDLRQKPDIKFYHKSVNHVLKKLWSMQTKGFVCGLSSFDTMNLSDICKARRLGN